MRQSFKWGVILASIASIAALYALALFSSRLPRPTLHHPPNPPLLLRGHEGGVGCVAVSPDGQTIASGGDDHTIKLWDLPSAREKRTLRGHTDAVLSLAFIRDGQTLVSAGRDGTVRFWDTATGRPSSNVLKHGAPVEAIAVGTDGKSVVSGADDGLVRVWDAITLQVQRVLDKASGKGDVKRESIWRLAVSPDGSILACGGADGQLALWDLSSAKLRALLRSPKELDGILSVAFSVDGKTLAVGYLSSRMRLVDVATGKEKETLPSYLSPAWAVRFTPDGQRLLAGTNDGFVASWYLADHTAAGQFTSNNGYVTSITFTPDGKRMITSHGDIYEDHKVPGVIAVWDFP